MLLPFPPSERGASWPERDDEEEDDLAPLLDDTHLEDPETDRSSPDDYPYADEDDGDADRDDRTA